MGSSGKRSRNLPMSAKPLTPGSADIQQNQIEIRICCRGRQPSLSRTGCNDAYAVTEAFERRGDSFENERMIVNDE